MIAVLASLSARDDTRLTTLPVALDPIGHSVGITASPSRTLSPSAEALVRNLREIASAMIPPDQE
jgi:hypothetical protein